MVKKKSITVNQKTPEEKLDALSREYYFNPLCEGSILILL
jgi:hypothetical protein